MSIEALNWALSQKLDRSSAKFVLVAMANCANEDMKCWPSIAHLSEATCQDRKTVLENIKRLKELGIISDTDSRMGRTLQVTVFALNKEYQKRDSTEIGTVPKKAVKSPVIPRKESRYSVETVPKTGHGTINEPSIEPSIEPSLNTVGEKAAVSGKRNHQPEKQEKEFILPDWINALHWKAWRSHPKLRTASTDQKTIAVEKLAKWRDAGEDYAAALENAASSGYQGLFLPDNRTGNQRPSATAKASPGKHTGFQNLDYTTGINQDGTFT